MARAGRTVRASEIGAFIFCQRAWWYQRSQQPTINKKELAAGSDFHHRHAGRLRAARVLQAAGRIAIFIALVLLLLVLRAAWLN